MSSYLPRSLFDQAQPETADPTYRASMLPIGTYPNTNGSGEHLGLAWPGMIHEPMNALMNLIGTPSNPGTFTQGPDYGSNADDMRTLLETFLGGQATRGMGAVERGAVEAAPAVGGLRPGLTVTRDAPPGASAAWHNIDFNGDNIGKAYVREYQNTIQNSNFSIDPAYQRQGIGTEVQRHLAETYGKPTVPDFTLSEAAYQRWLKNDPAAVADYKPWFAGASQYSPSPLSDAYFAAQGGAPVPGTRAAAGELFSDNLPSLPGAVVAGAERNAPVRAYHGTAGDLQGGMFSRDRAGNNFPNEVSKFGVSFDTNPDVAAKYAEGAGIMPAYWKHLDETRKAPSREMIDELGQQSPAAIYPVDIYGRGADLSQGFHDLGATQMAAELQRLKDQGYDYARFPSERGQGHHEINVWNPGTVRSALTGETLFADGLPSLWSSAIQGQQNQTYPNSLFNP